MGVMTHHQKYYYGLFKDDKLILVNSQLPIYWDRKVAEKENSIYKAEIKRINGNDLHKILKAEQHAPQGNLP